MKRASKTCRITVALRMAGIAGQDKLNGIFNHLSEGRRWQLSIYRTAREFTAQTVEHELARGTSGFIVGIPETDDALRALAACDVPTVVMNISGGGIERRRSSIAFVRSDSEAIGRLAARELLKQGTCRSFGYAGYRDDCDWSRDRGNAFRDELAKAGSAVSFFDQAHYPNKIDDRRTLAAWLRDLPKPCGILAACDDRAFELLDACREIGLRVPSEAAFLGVNNDALLCENAEPRLSSVQPDFIGEGRLAAEILEKMLAGDAYRQKCCGNTFLVGVRQVVHRDSTRPPSAAGLLVQKALVYIEKNAARGIGVQDVARHLKVSYSLLNLRFQELQRESVYEAILRTRLNAVKDRLVTTNKTIDEIAAHFGWASSASLMHLFKRRFGVSMRTWRQDHGLTVKRVRTR